eukprot:1383404-Amorphochlora_amoeboformis.AAC.1
MISQSLTPSGPSISNTPCPEDSAYIHVHMYMYTRLHTHKAKGIVRGPNALWNTFGVRQKSLALIVNPQLQYSLFAVRANLEPELAPKAKECIFRGGGERPKAR